MSAPNSVLFGATKSGTTTLYAGLRAHPDVSMPARKDPHLYACLASPSTASLLSAVERFRPRLDPDVRAELTVSFTEEISRLGDLLQLDLTRWRS